MSHDNTLYSKVFTHPTISSHADRMIASRESARHTSEYVRASVLLNEIQELLNAYSSEVTEAISPDSEEGVLISSNERLCILKARGALEDAVEKLSKCLCNKK